MNKKTSYKKAPKEIADSISESKYIEDFLPPPEHLILKDPSVKVTINLSNQSVEFFKENANKIGVPYQQMIKKLLDKYVEHYKIRKYKAG